MAQSVPFEGNQEQGHGGEDIPGPFIWSVRQVVWHGAVLDVALEQSQLHVPLPKEGEACDHPTAVVRLEWERRVQYRQDVCAAIKVGWCFHWSNILERRVPIHCHIYPIFKCLGILESDTSTIETAYALFVYRYVHIMKVVGEEDVCDQIMPHLFSFPHPRVLMRPVLYNFRIRLDKIGGGAAIYIGIRNLK